MKEIIVKYKGTQRGTGEDLFQTVAEYRGKRSKVYIRQECNDNGLVLWLTATKYSQGYEASSPLKGNILVKVIGNDGEVLFEEQNRELNGDVYPGLRLYPMSWEYIRELEVKVIDKYSLVKYDDWKKWLAGKKKEFSYEGDDDKWIYSNCMAASATPKKLSEYNLYGTHPLRIVKETIFHKIAGVAFEEYSIEDDNDEYSGTIGYEIKEVSNVK